MGKTIILLGNTIILMGKTIILMGITHFRLGKTRLHLGKKGFYDKDAKREIYLNLAIPKYSDYFLRNLL